MNGSIDSRPGPRVLKVFGFFTIALLIGAPLASVLSQFVPSRLALVLGLVAAFGCAAVGTYLAAHPVKRYAGPKWSQPIVVRMLILGLLFFSFGWEATVQGVFAIYTEFAGVRGQQHFIVSGWRTARRFRCAGPDFVGTYQSTTICMDDGREAEFPPGSPAILEGHVSALGINVGRVSEGK